MVATASLELGIDVGAVELDLPDRLAALDRDAACSASAARATRCGATPKGRLFPLTRDELVECAALVRAARRGRDRRRPPARRAARHPGAADRGGDCACRGVGRGRALRAGPAGGALRGARRAATSTRSSTCCPRASPPAAGAPGALLHRDARQPAAARPARRAARRAHLGRRDPRQRQLRRRARARGHVIGTVDEDFAIESMAGDIFLLGNTSWRIRRVEPGACASRTRTARRRRSRSGSARRRRARASCRPRSAALREEIADGRRRAARIAAAGADDVVRARSPRRRAAARLPRRPARPRWAACRRRRWSIAERFFDEAGGMQLVIHAPFGGRINRAWGLALRKRFCRTFDFELQAAATDDGIVLSLGPQHSFPLETVFSMLRADDVEELLIQAALQAPMFETRWRWNATRSLALLRSRGGKRVPPPSSGCARRTCSRRCSRRRPPARTTTAAAPIEIPDHPLVRETMRDCLVEAMDVDGLRAVLEALARRRASDASARDTPEPSVFAHEILNANPYAFLDDAPLEERRTRAVALRRGLPADRRRADRRPRSGGDRRGGRRGAARSARRRRAARPAARSRRAARGDRASARLGDLFDALVGGRRAARLEGDPRPLGRRRAALARRRGLAGAPLRPRRGRAAVAPAPRLADGESALVEIVRGHLALAGPDDGGARSPRAWACARPTSRRRSPASRWRARCCAGASCPDAADDATQWCERRLLARINRRMLDGLRREIEPVSAADFLRFLFGWQHVRPGQPAARAARPGARDRAAAGLRGGGRRLGARDPAGARRRLRPGLARRALPLGRRQPGAGSPPGPRAARPAARRRSRSCAAPICPGCSRPTRTRPPTTTALSAAGARRARASWRAPARASSTRSSPARAACAPRSRTRSGSWCPPAA